MVDLAVKILEIKDETDVNSLVDDIRKRLLDRLKTGVRLRLS